MSNSISREAYFFFLQRWCCVFTVCVWPLTVFLMSLSLQGHLRQLTFLMDNPDAAKQHCSHHPPRCGESAPKPPRSPRTNIALEVRKDAWKVKMRDWYNSHHFHHWKKKLSFVPLTYANSKIWHVTEVFKVKSDSQTPAVNIWQHNLLYTMKHDKWSSDDL